MVFEWAEGLETGKMVIHRKSLKHVFEIVEHGSDDIPTCATVVKYVAAAKAFRRYEWLRNRPALNRLGDLRGMVVHARWRAAFQLADKTGEVFDNAALLACLAQNIIKSTARIEAILHSNESSPEKGRQLCYITSGLILRSIAEIPVKGVHDLAKAERAGRAVAGFFGFDVAHPGRFKQAMDFCDARVESWADMAFDDCAFITTRLIR